MQPGIEKWALEGDTRGERTAPTLPFSCVSKDGGEEEYSASSPYGAPLQ